MHMLKFVHYLNDRNGHAILQSLDQPETQYKSLTDLFEKVMKHEEYISASINELYGVTLTEKDYTSGSFLQWFITEQIEEESSMRAILDQIKLAGDTNLYHIDKELSTLAAAKVITAV